MSGCAVGSKVEGCGQVDVEACEFHLLQIAVKRTLDGNRMVRIAADEVGWHVPHEPHQVLLAQLRIQTHLHLAWIPVVEGVEVHVDFGIDV